MGDRPGRSRPELLKIRRLCLAMPGATERLSHAEPAWFSARGPAFATFADHHHRDGRLAIWCAAGPMVQEMLVSADPERFFVPPYVGGRGWLGVRLDRAPDWDEIARLLQDAHALVVTPGGAGRRRRDQAGSNSTGACSALQPDRR